MAFSHSPAVSHVDESYSASAGYDNTMTWFISNTDSALLQSEVSTSAPTPVWGLDATIDPALLLTQHQDLENYSSDAAPIHHF
ncbi:hypothetical protein ONS95_001973 [Cadophora gregata]|uniref:uncharacterized protein n=1 Tax=Cadophora gregata TaxID=51156 RepID=UPI0026DDC45C|nr:uncharacterized protein ONS95_001973 [Cadophora gregata]KAK0111627.1 hypothetical protein ONS95_001973 [Cadophora gregata]